MLRDASNEGSIGLPEHFGCDRLFSFVRSSFETSDLVVTSFRCIARFGTHFAGVSGLFLGSTAEKVLDNCDCSILTTKPDGFVSPIEPLK